MEWALAFEQAEYRAHEIAAKIAKQRAKVSDGSYDRDE
jgi:hypothetical protein